MACLVSPQKSQVEALTPQVMVCEDGALWSSGLDAVLRVGPS